MPGEFTECRQPGLSKQRVSIPEVLCRALIPRPALSRKEHIMTTHDLTLRTSRPAPPCIAAGQRQQEGDTHSAYRAPQVIALGSAVELVQGAGFTSFQDGRRFYRR
jgi:hypothetical protein